MTYIDALKVVQKSASILETEDGNLSVIQWNRHYTALKYAMNQIEKEVKR